MPKANELRIIAGKWRRRKLRFHDDKAIRPTPDRVRETVFNWLQQDIPNAHCLDAFAGSGALGFEALSRGAKSVVMIEPLRQQQVYLRENASLLEANITLVSGQFPGALSPDQRSFDLVFLDPPFKNSAVEIALEQLLERGLVRPGSLIYYESMRRLELGDRENQLISIKSMRAASVHYGLLRVEDEVLSHESLS